jgi:hypothetical protein
MSNTSNLVLPYLAAGQAQKHVTLNESLRRLDAIIQLSAVSATTTAEPASPADGAVYIVPPGKTGAHWPVFATGSLAHYRDGAWAEIAPRPGWLAFVRDTVRLLVFTGSARSPFVAGLADANIFTVPQVFASAHGASLRLDIIEQELTLTGASVTSSIAIPSGSICFGVSERVTQAVAGASSFKVGISGETSKFGDLLGPSPGSANFGIIGPTAFYADTAIMVTANGPNFTGGRVRLAIHVLRVTPPQS